VHVHVQCLTASDSGCGSDEAETLRRRRRGNGPRARRHQLSRSGRLKMAARCIRPRYQAIAGLSRPTIEILTPDFLRKDGWENRVIDLGPMCSNHNLETRAAPFI